ncbi:MAG: gamma-glutamyltransferase [Pseudomonadota bacterium]
MPTDLIRTLSLVSAVVVSAVTLTACGAGGDGSLNQEFTQREQAAVIADEPQAALVGRDILAQGGHPVDAAIAMSLALTVTLPSRAGLLGGGVCLVHDAGQQGVSLIDFRPTPLRRADGSPSEFGAPGLLRGLFVMHARHGRLRFEQLVIPAERLARFDGRVSRSLRRDMDQFASRMAQIENPIWRGSAEANVGQELPWDVMAGALAIVRQDGPGAFYGGRIGRRLALDMGVEPAAIAGVQPVVVEAPSVVDGVDNLFMAGQADERQLIQALASGGDSRQLAAASRLPGDVPPATSVVVKGDDDTVVACGLTQGMAFGIGEPTRDFGLWPARGIATSMVLGDGILGPFLMLNRNVNEMRLAGVVTGSDNLPRDVLAAATSVFDSYRTSPGNVSALTPTVGASTGAVGVGTPRRSMVSCSRANNDGDRLCAAAVEPGINGLAIRP